MNRRILLAVAALIVVVIGAVWANTSSDPPRAATRASGHKPDVSEGRALAARACARLDAFEAVVERNESARKALDELDRFEATARRAYDRDVVWIRLLSAAKALKAGFRDDDAEAARVGIETARTECRPLTQQ